MLLPILAFHGFGESRQFIVVVVFHLVGVEGIRMSYIAKSFC